MCQRWSSLAGPVIGTHAGAGFIGLAVTHT